MKKLLSALACALLLTACSDHGVAGTYVMDKSELMKGLEAMNPEMKKNLESFGSVDAEAKLDSGGTFTMTVSLPTLGGGGGKQGAKGTYKVEGDKITLTATERDGKKLDKPDPKTGTIKNGVITLREGALEMRLVKK